MVDAGLIFCALALSVTAIGFSAGASIGTGWRVFSHTGRDCFDGSSTIHQRERKASQQIVICAHYHQRMRIGYTNDRMGH
jgi:hypothetical protein